MNLVPFSQFAKELANNTLPAYSFITPNICNDAHNCTLATADNWLKTHINQLIQNPSFQNGLLIIVFDESANDNRHGGGRVDWIAISTMHSKTANKLVTHYKHHNKV